MTQQEQLDAKYNILTLLSEGAAKTVSEACRQLELQPVRVYAWITEDPEFKASISAVKEVIADDIEARLRDHANFIPLMFMLKAIRPEYRENYNITPGDSKMKELLNELAQAARKQLPAPKPENVITVEPIEILPKVEET